MNTDKIIYDVWLSNILGLSIKAQHVLLEICKTAQNVFDSIKEVNLTEAGEFLETSIKSFELLRMKDLSTAEGIIKKMAKNQIEGIIISDEEYPKQLLSIYDPPILIYKTGKIAKDESVAIVGARKASNYGIWVAKSIAMKLVEYNFQVVSGLARGVDTAAHIGALEGNGKTIAVLGCGLDICYPQSNKKLFDRISETGAILSEFPPGTLPYPYNFPRRNRIISGLSKVVIVAEAGIKSGSLITAGYALEQGKEVYAVPGNINNIHSLGTNKLIKDGANPLICIDDIISELGIKKNFNVEKMNLNLGEDERSIYELVFNSGEMTIDLIANSTSLPISQVKAIVSILEIKGVLESQLGKIFIA
ncbi:MAG: DNA-processing protein DprA [Eubacteriales bacterium]